LAKTAAAKTFHGYFGDEFMAKKLFYFCFISIVWTDSFVTKS